MKIHEKMKKISILLIVSFLAFACKDVAKQPENLPNKTEQLTFKNDSLEKEIILLKSLNDSLMKTEITVENYWFISAYNGSRLARLGIANPEKFVQNALRKRTDLIPSEAVLGGTMNFGKIQLLGNKWVIADYNDGHIQGRTIFEYQLNDKKELVFKVLASNDTE